MRGRTQKEPNDLWTDGQVFIEMCGRTENVVEKDGEGWCRGRCLVGGGGRFSVGKFSYRIVIRPNTPCHSNG